MIHRRIYIKGWYVDFFFYKKCYYYNDILSLVKGLNAKRSVSERIADIINFNNLNVGFTFANGRQRRAVVVIGRTSNGGEFLNTTFHELRHLSDHIAKSVYGEEASYVLGDTIQRLSDIICKMSCDCCRHKE